MWVQKFACGDQAARREYSCSRPPRRKRQMDFADRLAKLLPTQRCPQPEAAMRSRRVVVLAGSSARPACGPGS